MKKIILSIVIVKYRADDFLKGCLESIGENPIWEIIIVDNDKINVGYGAGCNLGAKKAEGKYLLFLNPDTEVLKGVLEKMINYLEINEDVGILGPKLFNSKNLDLQVTSTGVLNPLSAIMVFSFLNKIFPKNLISRKYFLTDWDRNSIREVGAVSGAALMIRKDVFQKIGGFDDKFFMYFEEHDLCLRVKKTKMKIIYYPEAGIIHYGGKSSQLLSAQNKKYLLKSRFYFFKKHYGLLPALLVESFLRPFEYFSLIL